MSYSYDVDGIRTDKTVNKNGVGTNHKYYTQNNKIVVEKRGSSTLEFIYDESGNPLMMIYAGTPYYYVTNQMGDVVKLVNSSGTSVAEYTYNAWGEHISSSGSMSSINPLRYRGYYFDEETGLYYLNSRYYDSKTCRFINADAALAQIGNVQSSNMFAYCFNNPVNMLDSSGQWPSLSTIFTAIAVVAVTVAAVAVVIATGGAAAPALAVAGGGIISGIAAGTAATVAMAALVTAGVSSVAAAASATVEKSNSKKMQPNHSVYQLVDGKGQVQYVGRTTNTENRKKKHGADPSKKMLTFDVIATGLNYYQARGLEQIEMLHCHTINTANRMNNQINGISPFNKNLSVYMEAGRGVANYLENQISNEILYWTGN